MIIYQYLLGDAGCATLGDGGAEHEMLSLSRSLKRVIGDGNGDGSGECRVFGLERELLLKAHSISVPLYRGELYVQSKSHSGEYPSRITNTSRPMKRLEN